MKKIVQRILIFILGVPAVVASVVLVPQYHHLLVNILTILLSALGAIEFSEILGKRKYRLKTLEAGVLGALSPLAMTLSVSFGVNGELVPAAFIIGATWLIASRTFSSQKEISLTNDRITSGLAVMIYPGLFMLWVVRMTGGPHATALILMFLLIVFANDSVAWASGMLWGKGNRGIIPASPNKSIVGFVGGLVASVALGMAAPALFPQAFTKKHLSPLWAGAILGLATGIVAIIGDLAESTIKRSGEVKDSGSLIPGRGGVLDSIDSLALSAPVYYALYWILF